MGLGAEQIRLRFSNAFGTTDLPITAVTVALPVPGANASAGVEGIQTSTLKNVTFSGSANFTIPDGGLVVSDPIDFQIQSLSTISVTMYLAQGQTTNNVTSHPGSRTDSWMTFGNQVTAANFTGANVQSTQHWYVQVEPFLRDFPITVN